jgi:hypothetical protein
MALKELHLQGILQLGDLCAQGWLRDPAEGGGRAKATALGDGDGVLDLAERERVCPMVHRERLSKFSKIDVDGYGMLFASPLVASPLAGAGLQVGH